MVHLFIFAGACCVFDCVSRLKLLATAKGAFVGNTTSDCCDANGECPCTLGDVHALSFSPSGTMLASCGVVLCPVYMPGVMLASCVGVVSNRPELSSITSG